MRPIGASAIVENLKDVTLLMTVYEHSVDFVVVEIMTHDWEQQDSDGKWQPHPIGYQRKDSSFEPDLITDPREAEPYISGNVKWDGCINYQVGIDNVAMHGCDEDDLAKVSRALLAVYRRCGELLIASGTADSGAFEELRAAKNAV